MDDQQEVYRRGNSVGPERGQDAEGGEGGKGTAHQILSAVVRDSKATSMVCARMPGGNLLLLPHARINARGTQHTPLSTTLDPLGETTPQHTTTTQSPARTARTHSGTQSIAHTQGRQQAATPPPRLGLGLSKQGVQGLQQHRGGLSLEQTIQQLAIPAPPQQS